MPFLFLLLRKEFRVLQSFLVGSIVLAFLSFLFIGAKGVQQYIRFFSEINHWRNVYLIQGQYMENWRGFLQLLFQTNEFRSIFIYWIAGVILITLLLFFTWQHQTTNKSFLFDLQWSSVIIGSILVSPYTSGQDLSTFVIPAILTVYWVKRVKNITFFYYLSLLLIILGYVPYFISDVIAKAVHIQIHAFFLFGMLFLVEALLRNIYQLPGQEHH